MREKLRGFEVDPGRGNLNAKAHQAAVVGPYRLAHGRQTSPTISATSPTRIAKCAGPADQVLFVAAMLPSNNAGPLRFWVGPGNMMGLGSPVVELVNNPGFLAGVSYSAVLLPGDELYLQAAGGANVQIVVSEVSF